MQEINLILPAQAAKMGGDLGAVLGQHGVNIVKFCKDFNELSVNYEYNLPIRTSLILEDKSSFQIKLINPVSTFLIQNFSNEGKISFLDIYKIVLIKKKHEILADEKSIFKNIISTIKSMRYKVIYE